MESNEESMHVDTGVKGLTNNWNLETSFWAKGSTMLSMHVLVTLCAVLTLFYSVTIAIQSTLALWTPHYHGQQLNPTQKSITDVWLKQIPAIMGSCY